MAEEQIITERNDPVPKTPEAVGVSEAPNLRDASYAYDGNYPYPMVASDEIVLLDVFKMLLRGSIFIVMVGGIFMVAGILIAYSTPPSYEATVVATPSKDEGISMPSAGGGALGMAGSLIGLNLGGGGASEFDVMAATMKSRSFTMKFIEEQSLLPRLFPSRWDHQNNKWLVRGGGEKPFLARVSIGLKEFIGNNFDAPHLVLELEEQETKSRQSAPSSEDIYKALTGLWTITTDIKTGLILLTVTHGDPQFASNIANGLVAKINKKYKLDQKATIESELAFLQQQYVKTRLVEVERALSQVMEETIKRKMVIEGRKDLALDVIDPAVPAEAKSKPNRKMIIASGLAIGLIFATFLSLIWQVARRQKRQVVNQNS